MSWRSKDRLCIDFFREGIDFGLRACYDNVILTQV